jgi:hypothetical protein
MKHLVILTCVFILFSCDTKYYTVTVRNKSAKTVTYTYNGVQDTLSPTDAKEYQAEAYTQPPGDISVSGAMSVKMEKTLHSDEYLFADVTGAELKIQNTLNIAVRIMAEGGYVEGPGDTPYVECSGNAETSAKVYTTRPVFKSVPKSDLEDYPVSFDWKILDDGSMTLTIR